jgi:ABC-type Mn2+/Zn2+ transport system ATPase subunit
MLASPCGPARFSAFAGLIGAGRTETLRTCFGLDRVARGTIAVFQRDKTRATPSARLADGIGLLSENRKDEGLMLNRTVADNLTLTRFAPISRLGFISGRRQGECARQRMQQLAVRAQGPRQTVGELSGGNQQKIAFCRLLHHDAKILLLDEPTRGIDVGSKAQIYQLIGQLAAEGRAVVFVSSYLPELLGVCDTIGVMCPRSVRRGAAGERVDGAHASLARRWASRKLPAATRNEPGFRNDAAGTDAITMGWCCGNFAGRGLRRGVLCRPCGSRRLAVSTPRSGWLVLVGVLVGLGLRPFYLDLFSEWKPEAIHARRLFSTPWGHSSVCYSCSRCFRSARKSDPISSRARISKSS